MADPLEAQDAQKPFCPAVNPTALEPWEYLDRQFYAFRNLLEQQQRFLQDLHEHVKAQHALSAKAFTPSHRGQSHLSAPALSAARLGSHCSTQGPSSAALSKSLTDLSLFSKRHDLPHVTIFFHGNNTPTSSFSIPTSSDIPPMRKGLGPWVKATLETVVSSPFFEPAMGCIIAANALNIGVAIDMELRGKDTSTVESMEIVFMFIFILELLMRAAARGWRSLMTGAGALDTFLVVLALLTELIKPLLAPSVMEVGTALDQMLILRIARLLRLARSARLVASLESLWKLANGLMRSMCTLGSAGLLILTTLYVFACFGAELIAKPNLSDPSVGELLKDNFSTMPKILLTLCQFIAMDSTAAIYYPLVEHTPVLSVYFWLIVIIVPIAMLNLITAVLVEDVISTVQADEEMRSIHRRRQFKQLTPALKDLFRAFDVSGDGKIQIEEVTTAIELGQKIPEALHAFLDPARMLDLFDAIDIDKSGDLSEEEFIDGFTYAALSDVSIETIQILHLLRSLKQDTNKLSSQSQKFHTDPVKVRPVPMQPELRVEVMPLYEEVMPLYDSEAALAI